MEILETKGIGIHFGGLKAVDNVDFSAEEGSITAIIGPNGAGKTTLFNLIAGFYTPTEGCVYFKGKDITNLKTYKRTYLGIARTFQNINLFRDLSVMDNVLLGLHSVTKCGPISAMLNLPNKKKEEKESRKKVMEVLEFLNLAIYVNEKQEVSLMDYKKISKLPGQLFPTRLYCYWMNRLPVSIQMIWKLYPGVSPQSEIAGLQLS